MRTFTGELIELSGGTIEVRDDRGVPLVRATRLEDGSPAYALVELADVHELSRAGLTREMTFLLVPGLSEANWESRAEKLDDLVGRDWLVCPQGYNGSRDLGEGYLLAVERWV